MTFTKVAIAGASGYVGRKVLAHLITIPEITKITILTQSTTTQNFPSSPLINVVPVSSYEDVAALTTALQGHDLLVSTIAGFPSNTVDPLLWSAAIAAGVRRFMPSEYTVDVMHPHSIDVAGSTVLAGKVANARKIQELADKGVIEYTTLVTGALLDWWFENDNPVIDRKNKKLTIFDGGDKKLTGVTVDLVAQAVGAVVLMPPESTKNQRIRLAEVEYSGQSWLSTFEEVTGEKWTVINQTTDAVLEEGKKAAEKGDLRGFYLGHILKLNFDGKGAASFEEGFTHGPSLKRQSLKDIVKKYFAV